mgnify:CR=1 FL=1
MTSRHPSTSCNSSPNCACPTCDAARASAGASCSSSGCAVTSQNQGLPSAGVGNRTIRGGKVRYSAQPEQRSTQLSTYAIPVLQLGEPSGRVTEFFGGMNDAALPQAETPVNLVRAAGAVNVVPAAGAVNLVPAAGAVNVVRAAGTAPASTTPPAPIPVPSAPPPPPNQAQPFPAKPGDQQAPQQGGIGIDAQTATALAGLGGTLLQGTRDIVVAAITQGAESERERGRQQAAVQIAQLQRQGLLTQQQAADALANVDRAIAGSLTAPPPPPPPPPPPQGFFESMTTGQKVALGVGGAAILAALGYGVYRATRD